jgi:hypothetical protein
MVLSKLALCRLSDPTGHVSEPTLSIVRSNLARCSVSLSPSLSHPDSSPPLDQELFFSSHYSLVYQQLLDSIQQQEHTASGGRRPLPPIEAAWNLTVLRGLLRGARAVVRTRWQERSIRGVVERALHPANMHAVRRLGVECLFALYEGLGYSRGFGAALFVFFVLFC